MFDSDPLFCLVVIGMLLFIYWEVRDVRNKLDEMETEDDSYE